MVGMQCYASMISCTKEGEGANNFALIVIIRAFSHAIVALVLY